jgi:hypothetical protein
MSWEAIARDAEAVNAASERSSFDHIAQKASDARAGTAP